MKSTLMNITLFIFLFISTLASSQTIVYRTFEDLQNKKGEEYGELDYDFYGDKWKLVFEKGGQKIKIRCEEIWGFEYKGGLFRIDTQIGKALPIRVIAIGKLVYYENGPAHIKMLRNESNSSTYGDFDGYATYISKTLTSELVPIEKSTIMSHNIKVAKSIKDFRKVNTEYEDFFNCLNNYRIETVRRCIAEFEGYEDFN